MSDKKFYERSHSKNTRVKVKSILIRKLFKKPNLQLIIESEMKINHQKSRPSERKKTSEIVACIWHPRAELPPTTPQLEK